MKKWKTMTVMLTAVLIIAMLSTGTLSMFSAVDATAQNHIPEWAVCNSRNNRSLAFTGANLPAAYDLRSEGIVTPVKLQSPWDSCWSFGGIAAAEISILSALGRTYNNYHLDLSERHLAYFAHREITEYEDPSQAGEGLHMTDPGENAEFNGGDFGLITSVFSQGVGPVDESLFPYRGNTSTYTENGWYSDADDWSIPAADEAGASNRLLNSGFVLKDGNILPEYWDADKTSFTDGANAIKQELINGRGVAIKYSADQSGKYSVSDHQKQAYFYGQYTFDDLSTDHDACIVGWDDNYDAANFSHTTDFYRSPLTDGEGTPLSEDDAAALTTPPGNGAWIVKNSRGSETDWTADDLGNRIGRSPVGIPDESGKASGYFYLSYYDKTICGAETMAFSADLSGAGQLTAMQYDYLPSQTQRFSFDDEEVMSSANVFAVDEPMELKSVSTATDKANMRVTFAIYRLNDNARDPSDGVLLRRFSQYFEYAGFHRVDLDDALIFAKGQRFSIVSTASVLGESGKRVYSVAANRSITEAGARQYNMPTYGVAVVNKGESFIYHNGQWVDWKDKLDNLRTQGTINEYQCVDNFSIKAYVVQPEETQSPDEPQTAAETQSGIEIQPAIPHEDLPLTAHPKVPATCGKAGTKAYWECETCQKLFSDANGYERINAPVVIPATDNHTYGDPEWTWTNDLSGATATFTCGVCGDIHEEAAEVVPTIGTDKTEYTACVTFNDQTYTDKKVVYDDGVGARLAGYTISLDGDIGVNFYMELAPAIVQSETAVMHFTIPNSGKITEIDVPVSQATVSGNYYVFKCNIAAKEMTSRIKAQIIDGETCGTEYTYSVKDYADYLLANADANGTNLQKEYADAAPLVKAMLNYGTAAQTFFGVNTDKPANANLSADDKVIADVTAADINKPYDGTHVYLPDGVTFTQVSLSLKTETTLSLYFENTGDKNLIFACTGKMVDFEHSGTTWIARIRGIKADEIGSDFGLSVSDGTTYGSVTYSPMTYCYNVLNRVTDDENLTNVVKALYWYWKAAEAYFS